MPGVPHTDANKTAFTASTGVVGAVAGVAAGAIAGPVGMVAGGVLGAIAGAATGVSIDERQKIVAREEERLDEEIGVMGGDLGARPVTLKEEK